MKIQRNYLYRVRLALEDPVADTYGKVTHAINVKDWTTGVTLAWAGDENLYNNQAAANFTVTGTERKLRDATASDPEQHLVLPYNAEMSATFYVTSTSTKSGLSLTCPATAVAATAEELALNTSADNYQCKIENLSGEYVYSENSTFTQKWKVTVRQSAFKNGSTLTFSLQNALNSALSTKFEVRGNLYEGIAVGDIIYEDGLWTHNVSDVATKMSAGHTPVAIVFATTNEITMPEYDLNKGYINGYAMALKENETAYQWSTSTLTSFIVSGLEYSDMSTEHYNQIIYDYSGLEHCDLIQEKIDNGEYMLDNLPVYKRMKEYKAVEDETLTNYYTSHWFLPSTGLVYRWLIEFAGKADNLSYLTANGANRYTPVYWQGVHNTWKDAMNTYMQNKVGAGNFTPFLYREKTPEGWYATSTEYHYNKSGTSSYNCMILDIGWVNGTNLHFSTDYGATGIARKYRVRPVIAF